jgi:hypothetical protein
MLALDARAVTFARFDVLVPAVVHHHDGGRARVREASDA